MAANDTKRAQVAKHEWIDTRGEVVKSIEDATGTRYTLLANDEYVDMQFDAMPSESQVMSALFGIRTRATNASSTARNANDGDPDAQIAAVKETWDAICDGEWGEGRTSGAPIFLVALATARATPEKGTDDARVKRLKKWLRDMDDDARVAHASRDQIVAAIADIRAERAAARAKELRARLGTSAASMSDVPA